MIFDVTSKAVDVKDDARYISLIKPIRITSNLVTGLVYYDFDFNSL